MEERAIRAVISGAVQGVSFRAWTCEEARTRGLRGWVRNEADGTVEAVIAGEADAVESLHQALWQGPSAARVDDVRITPIPSPAAHAFEIRR